jgi:hypothetical protein
VSQGAQYEAWLYIASQPGNDTAHTQADMISLGFSARHWQQIEAGRPMTVPTPLRICAVFRVRANWLIRVLDKGVYGR